MFSCTQHWGSRLRLDILKSKELREIEFHDDESSVFFVTLVAEAALENQLETLLLIIKVTLGR